MRVLRLLAPLVVVACGSSGGSSSSAAPPIPTELATVGSSISTMALVGGDLLCAANDKGIVRIATATGQVSPYAPSERPATLVADAAHVAWIASESGIGVHELVKVAPVGDGSHPVTLADETREIGAVALDDGFVYWTVETDVFPDVVYDISRAPVAGGTAIKLATGVQTVGALGLDATTLYFVSDDALFSLPKTGGTPAKILGNATGLGGADEVLVDDVDVTFIGATGGGATQSFVAWAPKSGGAKQTYAFPCQGIAGIAADASSIFATCNTDITGFKTTPALTVRKIAKGGTTVATIGQLPSPDSGGDRFGAVVVDATRAYVAYGSKVLAVAK